MREFTNVISKHSINQSLLNAVFGEDLTNDEKMRIQKISSDWDFYKGLHWEDIEDTDKPQVTKNYIRKFVDKYVAFEFKKGFVLNMKPDLELLDNNNPKDFIINTWNDNNKAELLTELGQSKAVTGDSWFQVYFEPKYITESGSRRINPDFEDPFGIYDKGRIRLFVIPNGISFPKFEEGSDKNKLLSFRMMYPIEVEEKGLFRTRKNKVIKTITWTKEFYEEKIGDEIVTRYPNKYGVIPIRQFKNIPIAGEQFGQNDIDDVVPLNVELNLKTSDISEIIDYHSAPVTVVFGARVSNLERGANKVWGGLPYNAKVENLKLEGDLKAATEYLNDLKEAMHEIGGIPVGSLGGKLEISNTSGVALEMVLMPLLERISLKQIHTAESLQYVNSLILLIAEKEGLISIPDGVSRSDFFRNHVTFESALPKDGVRVLQEIESEMAMGLENRVGALERLGREDIATKIQDIDEDRKANPELYGKRSGKMVGQNVDGGDKKTNAGDLNSPEVRKV